MSGGKGGEQTQTVRAEIPRFLRPFIRQGASVGSGALGELENLLRPGADLVAGFDPLQQQAQEQQVAVAGGAGGFLPTAQDALLSTARGDFLHGGPGFDAAVDAATRAAQPHILSTFGRAGRGVSGLGQAALGQAHADAFANLFNQERNRQLNAATALPGIGLAGTNILNQVGGQRQALAQRRLLSPVEQQERLFQTSIGVTPSQSSLFGETTTASLPGGGKAGDALGLGLGLLGLPIGGGASLGGALGSRLFGGLLG